MWDARVNTGVLREIWHSDGAEVRDIAIADDLATFVTLREELTEFLRGNGVFRDIRLLRRPPLRPHLCRLHQRRRRPILACRFLRRRQGDAMAHTRRLLGLDAVDTKSGRTRLKLIDGVAHVLGEPRRLGSS